MKEKFTDTTEHLHNVKDSGNCRTFTDPAADTAFLYSLYILWNNGCAGWNDRKSNEQYQ